MSTAGSNLPQHHSPPNPVSIPPRTSSTGHRRSSSSAGYLAAAAAAAPTAPTAPLAALRTSSIPAPAPALAGGSSSLDDWAVRRGGPSIASNSVFPDNMHPPASGSAPAPAPDPSRYAHEDLDFTKRKTWSEEKEKVVTGPFDYLFAHPGKDFRTELINSFDAWLEVPPASLEIITRVVGMLHTASLLVDDVEDSSSLRRGYPVAHNIFGVAQTINSANYIYFLALQELQRLGNPATLSVYAEELLHLHRGQGMDLFWRDTLTCPTEEDYLEMVGNKTGGLFRLSIKLMQAESASTSDCAPLVSLIGLIFQVRDDYMNLSSPEYSHNKGLCEDLTEGKFSFPIIHAIRSDPTDLQLINILAQKTTDAEVKRYAVAYMERTGSFEYTRQVVRVLISRARKLVDEIDAGRGKAKGMHKILDKMAI
ncbi:probable farnesyltranstransferase (al-3) [Cephalotrichum gorgonifer]|uniref:Probable farnesyltranstransferase (Al-3) n=1 Tax=Cephalotrichum gorgonifer TaxID=2041049 RepID=A0AAE8MQ30_9PEZI|nr:probable farnesyltranstransferase (al-3) [Cephalotrichum gorgonifer]